MNRLLYRLLSCKTGAGFEIRILMRQTAGVFKGDAPRIVKSSDRDPLKRYAEFSAEAANKALHSGRDQKKLHQDLYDMAFRLGSSLRRWMQPKDEKECLALLILLYKNIGITIREESPGKICVLDCYFSSFYTPGICAVISAIDAGIFAGIYQGGSLSFLTRITEGQKECRADFLRP